MDDSKKDAVLDFAREVCGRRVEAKIRGGSDDGYRFDVDADGVLRVEAANVRGALYAAYEARAGRRSGREAPAFAIRGLNPCESLNRHTPEQIASLIDRMGRWRMNTLIVHSNYGYETHRSLIERETDRRGIERVHYTYSNLCFLDGIAAQHFARSEDGEPLWSRLECETRLCVSDSAGLDRYARNVDRYLDAHPEYERLIFCTADGAKLCRCPRCRRLDAIEQWQRIFDPFFDAAFGRRRLEMLAYVQRFRVPDDLSRIGRLDRVLFDTHLRYPRAPLGVAHAWMKEGLRFAYPPGADPIQDPRGDVPINVYLWDRLAEWRRAFAGPLYVFENLMIQGLWACPRPNTSVYLDDLKRFKALGVDGVVYEAYEPGIEPFLPVFDALSETMWNLQRSHRKTAFEEAYLARGADDREFLASRPGHDQWTAYRADGYPCATLAALAYRLDTHFRAVHRPSAPPGPEDPAAALACCREILDYVLDPVRRESLDWIYIAFNTLKRAYELGAIQPADAREGDFLTLKKLWDFQERHAPPREAAAEVIVALHARLGR